MPVAVAERNKCGFVCVCFPIINRNGMTLTTPTIHNRQSLCHNHYPPSNLLNQQNLNLFQIFLSLHDHTCFSFLINSLMISFITILYIHINHFLKNKKLNHIVHRLFHETYL